MADRLISLFDRGLLSDPGSRGFSIDCNGQFIQGFVVCRQQRLYAYLNSCPHTGAPLDWVDHQFLDLEKTHIQCAVHDARFDVESGRCVAGPCVGQFLKPLAVQIENNQVCLVAPEIKGNSELTGNTQRSNH